MSDYTYDAIVRGIHDGDTITVDIDLGLDVVLKNFKIRLYGINAPELATPEGKAALAYIQTLIYVGQPVTIETIKDAKEKYGRYLAKVDVVKDGKVTDVNQAMIDSGHAKPYFGVGPKP